ncbi:MAG: insulinase family protein [Sedimentisphaerales bacterium]|nr:insulinase family protein [Sedimentisphaerales bacterium]
MEFKQAQLDNGLVVMAEVVPSARSLAIGFFVRTGSRDETAEVSGVSHFLEHMMFKGTAKRSAIEVNLEFDQMGAKYNAFTSEENTVYYAAVLPEYQQRVLDLWADLMRPALRDDDFNTEKGVICEEIAMYRDLPHFDVLDRCRRQHFGEHPAGNSVLGTVESIGNMTSEGMRDYFARRYGPDNMILAATGKVDWPGLLEQARGLCSSWQASGAQRQLSDYKGTGLAQMVQNDKITREHICLITAAPSAQHELRYAAGVLANIIGDETGSRFYWALVDSALADSADMDYDTMDGTGAYYTYISCDPQQTSRVVDIVKEIFEQVRREGVTEKELRASKNKMASHITLNGELPMGRLVPLGFNWIYRREYCSLEEDLRILQSVTSDDIRNLLDNYPMNHITILGLGPLDILNS